MSGIELVIFDCDGVLIDSERIASTVLMEMLRELGWNISFEEVVKRFKGLNASDTVAAIEAAMGQKLPAGFIDAEREEAVRRFEASLLPIPGIEAVLEGLRLPRCVASSSEPARLIPSLEMTGLSQYFVPHIYSSTLVERGKPFPDLFLYAARQLGVAPEDCVVIEDSPAGVRAGVSAGMRVLGYADLTAAEQLESAGATVFRSMDALPGLLQELGVTGQGW